jgi:hypothetical protein
MRRALGAETRSATDVDDLRFVDVLDQTQLLDLAAHVSAWPQHHDTDDGGESEGHGDRRKSAPSTTGDGNVGTGVVVGVTHRDQVSHPDAA